MTRKDDVLLARKERKEKLAKASHFFREGQALIKSASTKEDLLEAAEQLTVAVGLQPENPRYYMVRGNCFQRLGELQRAFFDFSSAIRLDSSNASHFCSRGLTLRRLGRLRDALSDFTRAIEVDPGNAALHYNRALAHHDLEEYSAAIRDFSLALRDERHAFRAYFHRGSCHQRLGNLPNALSDLKAAAESEPTNPSALNSLGLTHLSLQQFNDARNCFAKAVELDRNCAEYNSNLGLALYNEGENLKDCLACFETAIKIDGDEPQYYFNRGNARLARGEHKRAIADLKHALEGDAQNAIFCHALGLAHQDRGTPKDDAEALVWFREALSRDADHVPSSYHASLMLHRLGRYTEALHGLDEVLAKVPKDRLVFESRGLVLQDMRRHRDAEIDFTTAISLAPDYPENYYHRGESYHRLEKFNEALLDFNSAIELGYEDPAVYNARAMTHRALGDIEAAIRDLDAALEKQERKGRKGSVSSTTSSTPDGKGNADEVSSREAVELLHTRSLCSFDLEDYEGAANYLSTALNKVPHDAKLLHLRGLARFKARLFDRAAEDLKLALAHTPSFVSPASVADTHYVLGLALACQQDFAGAECHFSRALRCVDEMREVGGILRNVEREATKYMFEQAKALQMLRRTEDALVVFNEIVMRAPTNSHVRFRRAFAHKALGDFERAAEDFEYAKALDPKNPNLVVNYRRLHNTEVVVLCDPGAEIQWKTGLEGPSEASTLNENSGEGKNAGDSVGRHGVKNVGVIMPERPRSRRRHRHK